MCYLVVPSTSDWSSRVMSVPLMCGQGCAVCGSGMEIGTLAMSDAQGIVLDAKKQVAR